MRNILRLAIGVSLLVSAGCSRGDLSPAEKEEVRAIAREEAKSAVEAEYATAERKRREAYVQEEGRMNARLDDAVDNVVAAADAELKNR